MREHRHCTKLTDNTDVLQLGVTIDDRLGFDDHVVAIVSKVSQTVGALWQARRCLTLAARIAFMKAMV